MTHDELVVQLKAKVRKGDIDRGEAIDQLHQYADGGLTWQGAADLFAGRLLDLDGRGNATL